MLAHRLQQGWQGVRVSRTLFILRVIVGFCPLTPLRPIPPACAPPQLAYPPEREISSMQAGGGAGGGFPALCSDVGVSRQAPKGQGQRTLSKAAPLAASSASQDSLCDKGMITRPQHRIPRKIQIQEPKLDLRSSLVACTVKPELASLRNGMEVFRGRCGKAADPPGVLRILRQGVQPLPALLGHAVILGLQLLALLRLVVYAVLRACDPHQTQLGDMRGPVESVCRLLGAVERGGGRPGTPELW